MPYLNFATFNIDLFVRLSGSKSAQRWIAETPEVAPIKRLHKSPAIWGCRGLSYVVLDISLLFGRCSMFVSVCVVLHLTPLHFELQIFGKDDGIFPEVHFILATHQINSYVMVCN